MRIASLDIGTNTVLLLIVEVDSERIRVIRDDHAIARLGEGVDRTGRISDEACERFLSVLTVHSATIKANNVDHIAAVTTSAVRDAENRDEIIRRAKEGTGIEIELLSGDDEAQWTYRGALLGANLETEGSVGVVDIGGGSTEISIGDGKHFESGVSMDIGAVRITERCFPTVPVSHLAIDQARRMIRETLHQSIPIPLKFSRLIAVAGTPTTLAAMDQLLFQFDAARVQNYILRRDSVDRLLYIMSNIDTPTLLEHFPAINKARADILPAGTLILAEVMEFCSVRAVRVSTRGLRYGIALREAIRHLGERDYTIEE